MEEVSKTFEMLVYCIFNEMTEKTRKFLIILFLSKSLLILKNDNLTICIYFRIISESPNLGLLSEE